ncbi:Polar-differentiation response regulator DivK [Candidatus Arcanobacter lacustris]|uniref:Polar-differentiation response regulator DivK n=1 Tax=Candidatus Arcanibacter lacustris TaxID=1607817 RepID=A0A0F5MPS0_9RICK|nr:Polar-differentiation response regulator DivK [Candidatus Arcanobacter lacustris]
MNNKVLIVEDHELNLKLFRDLLELKGAEVLSTNDGSLFYDMALSFMPDLILMDIKLQLISGYDLIKQIKSDPITKHIPIIAITAFATKNDEEKLLKAGCASYIAKPFAVDYFFDVISNFLELKTLTEELV